MDWEKSKDKWGDWLPSKNFVDLTGLTGPMHTNVENLIAFLRRPDLIKKSYAEGMGPTAIDELRRSKGLRPATKQSLLDVLLSKRSYYDERYSEPAPSSRFREIVDTRRALENSPEHKYKRSERR